MKLDLHLDGDSKSSQLYAGDTVRAMLEMRGDSFKTLPQVRATLQGQLKVKVCPSNSGYNPKTYTHTLHNRTQQLSLVPQSIIKNNQAIYVPFEFELPANLQCGCSEQCQLPPSTSIDYGKLGIAVTYKLCIEVERPSYGGFNSVKNVERELQVSSSPHVTNSPASCITAFSIDHLESAQPKSKSDAAPPAYSPSLKLELSMENGPVLVREKESPLHVTLHTPKDVLDSTPLYIRTTEVRLRTNFAGRSTNDWHDMDNVRHGSTVEQTTRVDATQYELKLGSQANFVTVEAKPTARSCVFKMDYFLEAVVGISNGPDGPVQKVTASLPVSVLDPPPQYE